MKTKALGTVTFRDGYSFELLQSDDKFIRRDSFLHAHHDDGERRYPYSRLPYEIGYHSVVAICYDHFQKMPRECFCEIWHQRKPMTSENLMYNGYQG